MFWAEIWKISEFLSENFQFWVVKFSMYLNRRVFVMNGYPKYMGFFYEEIRKILKKCLIWNYNKELFYSIFFSGTPTIPVIPPVSKGGIPASHIAGQQTVGLPGQPAPVPNFTQSPVLAPGKLIYLDLSVWFTQLLISRILASLGGSVGCPYDW